MASLGIEAVTIAKCYKLAISGASKLITSDRDIMLELGIVTQPAISVNNQTYRGELNGFDIFKGVCNGFEMQPSYCNGDKVWTLLSYDDDEITLLESQVAPKYRVIAAILIAILINVALFMLYRRHQRKKMNEELQV